MLVVFANNQCMVPGPASTATIYTDPVRVGDNNRATGITNIHTLVNAGNPGLVWEMEVSNDGTTWVSQGPSSAVGTAVGETLQIPADVTCVFARLAISFTVGASVIGAVVFYT